MGPVQTPLVYPAAVGPSSISVVSSSRCAALSRGTGPGGFPVSRPGVPSVSYQPSHRFTEPRVTPSSAARSTTRRPSRYPTTARARRHTSKSCSLRAVRSRRRTCFRPEGDRPRGPIASPVLARAMTTSGMGDRDTVILSRSEVKRDVSSPEVFGGRRPAEHADTDRLTSSGAIPRREFGPRGSTIRNVTNQLVGACARWRLMESGTTRGGSDSVRAERDVRHAAAT